ncbi:hypothetical protein [Streptomyces sp. Wh19]|uniref:hypothetical protein n=1 Tax=Streptomyces sp. Wh19 TaxID=3076629 RepID=UPI0029589422|nr:hypothetical protein [Streptomyces sp. Wh19]MDV9194340.1 hypothetical protein [Streptomyces sp. Wh19]
MNDRIRLDDLTDNDLDQLYNERDAARRMLDLADLRLVDEMLTTVTEYRTRAKQAEARVAELEQQLADADAVHDDLDTTCEAVTAIDRVRALATRWAVLRAYGSAATELRAALDEQPTT